MTEDSPLVASARRLLDDGASVADVLSFLEGQGCTEMLPLIKALREIAPIGLSIAAEIVDAHRRGDPRARHLDRSSLRLLAHPGVREVWEGAGRLIYQFFRSAVMDRHDAWTLVPTGQTQYGHSFHFWWRTDTGALEGDPRFGSISGSDTTITAIGEALRRAVLCDPVLARHIEIVSISDDRITCRFHLDPPTRS